MTAAVELGRSGDRQTAREQLETLWAEAGNDAFGRCTVAHYLADLQETTEAELEWDLRALSASDELPNDLHAGLTVESLLPSLHLNLADDYRRISQPEEAQLHLDEARQRLGVLGEDAYGDLIRGAVERVAQALKNGSTDRLPTNPSTAS
jgi:hypothetical protein